MQKMKNGGRFSPLFIFKICVLDFLKIFAISFILQLLLMLFFGLKIENEVRISFWGKKEIDTKTIEKFYISNRDVLSVVCYYKNDNLIIKYWTQGIKKYITPAKIIEKPKDISLSRNFISSIFSSANLFIFLFSFQISLLYYNILSFIKKKKDFLILNLITKKAIIFGIICSIVLISFGFLWEKFISKTFSEYLFNFIKELGIKNKFLFLIIGTVFAPLNEEIFFRGIILGRFLLYNFKFYGILISSFLFAVIHFDLLAFPIIFLFGILLAYFYIKGKSIMTPIISHILNNFLFFVLTFIL